MSESLIITEIYGRVGLVRLNRPKALNALNMKMLNEVMDALEFYDADDGIGAMVICGNERAFAAGADIKEMAEETPITLFQKDFIAAFHRIRNIQKPIIAAVAGYCLGGGNELALSCDMIVAAETAKFSQPEITLGINPGAGGTQRLTRTLGKALAMEMVLNNCILTAQEAFQWGLINRVSTIEKYLDDALTIAAEIASRSSLAVRFAKEAVNRAYETTLTEGIASEEHAFYLLFASEDQKEGMRAFTEKRQPVWHGK